MSGTEDGDPVDLSGIESPSGQILLCCGVIMLQTGHILCDSDFLGTRWQCRQEISEHARISTLRCSQLLGMRSFRRPCLG